MRLIRQRRGNDCGVAAVAMLCGVSYDRALAAFTPEIQRRMTKLRAGTSTADCRHAIKKLGWECDTRLRPLRKHDLKTIEGRALLAVRPPASRKNGHWHWMAFEGTRDDWMALCPASMLEPYVCDSYLRVWRP